MSETIETLPSGARQSATGTRYDLMPAHAVRAVAEVLDRGARKYGVNNWVPIPVDSHLNHAVNHVYLWLAGDRSEDHLTHAACRLLMAKERATLDASWSEKEAT